MACNARSLLINLAVQILMISSRGNSLALDKLI